MLRGAASTRSAILKRVAPGWITATRSRRSATLIPLQYLSGPARFGLAATVVAEADGYQNPGTVYMQFAGTSGVSLPVGSPVFNLPPGCTCNSVDTNISDNYVVEPTSVNEATWGSIKASYR